MGFARHRRRRLMGRRRDGPVVVHEQGDDVRAVRRAPERHRGARDPPAAVALPAEVKRLVRRGGRAGHWRPRGVMGRGRGPRAGPPGGCREGPLALFALMGLATRCFRGLGFQLRGENALQGGDVQGLREVGVVPGFVERSVGRRRPTGRRDLRTRDLPIHEGVSLHGAAARVLRSAGLRGCEVSGAPGGCDNSVARDDNARRRIGRTRATLLRVLVEECQGPTCLPQWPGLWKKSVTKTAKSRLRPVLGLHSRDNNLR